MPDHNNPIDQTDVSDDERAEMLATYLEAISDICPEPKLMPLDDEGKAPIIQGRCRLNSPDARNYLVPGHQAVERIRDDGERGYAIYAGNPDHGTDNLVLVDVDDQETFPYEHFPSTLEVISGSGRGEHFTYENGGDVENAKGKNGIDGEIRAKNWYCVTPGSIHPTGGIYHITNERPVRLLYADDLPDDLKPSTGHADSEIDIGDITPPDDLGDAEFENEYGTSLENIREHDEKLDDLLTDLDPIGYGYQDDTSAADAATASKLYYWRFTESQIIDIIRKYRARPKVRDRPEYVADTVSKFAHGDQCNQRTLADGGATVSVNSGESNTQPTSTHDPWSDIRGMYATADANDTNTKKHYVHRQTGELLNQEHHWLNLHENDELYHYDPDIGIYNPRGDTTLREILYDKLGEHFRKQDVAELAEHVRAANTITKDEIGGPEWMLATANGVLEISNPSDPVLLDHDPAYNFLSRLDTPYQEDADCPEFKAFLDDVVTTESDKKKLQEFAGYTLYHWDVPWHKSLFIVGPQNSGKSTFANTVRSLLGEDTVASLNPQQMTSRFGGAELHGKWANIRNDIPSDTVKDTGQFKEIIAGEPLKAERKGKDPFNFEPNAKHVFVGNQLPDVKDDDGAFYRRILLVAFPRTVPRSERDRKLGKKLEDEMPGILNWALEGLARLLEKDGFTGDLTPHLTAEKWDKWGHTVDRFAQTCLEVGEADADPIPKGELYSLYQGFCDAESMPCEMQQEMTRRLKTEHGAHDGHAVVDGENQRVFTNIELTSRAAAYADDDSADDIRNSTL